MNKDVIYIEPDDDITDIISKIENSKEKIVALVPPKKASILRSIVNIKLITKTSSATGKTVVLVTTDPSIVKLAAATKIPVTKNLQTAPVIPEISDEKIESTSKEELVEDKNNEVHAEEVEGEAENKEDIKPAKNTKDADEEDEDDDEDGDEDNKKSDKKDKKDAKKGAKTKSKSVGEWIKNHKKLTIFSGIGIVLLILLLVWALAIAPAATITVGIRTNNNNFSKNVDFTTKLTDENIDEGKFFIEEKKIENEKSVHFEATGKKNIGEKATGSVVIYAEFSKTGQFVIEKGTEFSIGELTYTANEKQTLSWNGEQDECENNNKKIIVGGVVHCQISERIDVTAAEPGEKYNIAASSAGWKTNAAVSVYSDSAMEGGSDKIITVIQQSDIEKAKSELKATDEQVNKDLLLESLGDGFFPIESSFKQTVGDAVSTPAVGEEVKEGQRPKLSVKVSSSILAIDKVKVEEFIAKEAKLAENYKIYQINDPFVENFVEVEGGYVGKIKASYVSGPKVTENDVIEIVKGKGLGIAQHDLKEIDGISNIRIDTSFPWVMSIPNNPNKITVILNVEN